MEDHSNLMRSPSSNNNEAFFNKVFYPEKEEIETNLKYRETVSGILKLSIILGGIGVIS